MIKFTGTIKENYRSLSIAYDIEKERVKSLQDHIRELEQELSELKETQECWNCIKLEQQLAWITDLKIELKQRFYSGKTSFSDDIEWFIKEFEGEHE